MRLLSGQSSIPRHLRIINKKTLCALVLSDIVILLTLSLFVYYQPQFILKSFKFDEKYSIVPTTSRVLRQKDNYQESGIQSDFLINQIDSNKFVLMPEYKIIKKELKNCPKNECDSIDNVSNSKDCGDPDLKTGDNIWCTMEILKERMFQNLETIDFKIYRRILPTQYQFMIGDMDIQEKSNRRVFEGRNIPSMNLIDRLVYNFRSKEKKKSFVAGMELIGSMSFQELFYKIKVC